MYALVAVPSSVGGSASTCLIATIGGSYRATLALCRTAVPDSFSWTSLYIIAKKQPHTGQRVGSGSKSNYTTSNCPYQTTTNIMVGFDATKNEPSSKRPLGWGGER